MSVWKYTYNTHSFVGFLDSEWFIHIVACGHEFYFHWCFIFYYVNMFILSTLEDIWSVSNLELLWVLSPWIVMYMSLGAYKYTFLCVYTTDDIMSHKVYVFTALWYLTKQYSIVGVLIYTSVSAGWTIQLLHVLDLFF